MHSRDKTEKRSNRDTQTRQKSVGTEILVCCIYTPMRSDQFFYRKRELSCDSPCFKIAK